MSLAYCTVLLLTFFFFTYSLCPSPPFLASFLSIKFTRCLDEDQMNLIFQTRKLRTSKKFTISKFMSVCLFKVYRISNEKINNISLLHCCNKVQFCLCLYWQRETLLLETTQSNNTMEQLVLRLEHSWWLTHQEKGKGKYFMTWQYNLCLLRG